MSNAFDVVNVFHKFSITRLSKIHLCYPLLAVMNLHKHLNTGFIYDTTVAHVDRNSFCTCVYNYPIVEVRNHHKHLNWFMYYDK